MTTGIGDFGIATEFRDIVLRIVQDEIAKKIAFKYGRVYSISADFKTIMVVFPEAPTTPIKVRIMNTVPREVGQIVQVQVDNGLYTLIAVMGPGGGQDYTGSELGQVVGLLLSSINGQIKAVWTAISRAQSYEVQFAEDISFTVNLRSFQTIENTYTAACIPSFVYYVRVRALSSSGATPGVWSVVEHIMCEGYEGGGDLTDGNPPATSPTAIVVPGIGYLYVSWDPTPNADLVSYDVHLGLTTGFTPSEATWVLTTSSTFAFIRTLADGVTPLSYGTTYFVRIIARDADGSGPAGVQGYGAPQVVNTGDAGQIASPNIVPDGQLPPQVGGLAVDNGMGFLYVHWTMVTNVDPVRYEVHVSSSSGFTPSSNTLVLYTPSSYAFVRNVGPGAGSGALVYGTTYYIKVVARDADGAGTPSGQVFGNTVRVNTADISSLAITSALLADNAVTGDKISAGSVTANKIAAGSITTAQMVVGGLGLENQVLNGGFEEADPTTPTRPASWTTSWWVGNGGTVTRETATGVISGSASMRISLPTQTDGQRVVCRAFPVRPGETYYVSFKYSTSRDIATTGAVEAHFCTALTSDVYQFPGGNWQTIISTTGSTTVVTYEGQFTVPVNNYWCGIMVSNLSAVTGGGYYGSWDDVVVKQVVISAVIGQGAITTPKIQVGAITAESAILADLAVGTAKIADLAITTAKIADMQVSQAKIGYLAVGDAQIGSVAASKIVAGSLLADMTVSARIKTADTGARVELNATGFHAYDSGNSETVGITASGGSGLFTGVIRTGISSAQHVALNPYVGPNSSGAVVFYATGGAGGLGDSGSARIYLSSATDFRIEGPAATYFAFQGDQVIRNLGLEHALLSSYVYTRQGTNLSFNWSGQGGQPNWLWGGNDGYNMYVYNPSNFSVNWAGTSSVVSQSGIFFGPGGSTNAWLADGETWLRIDGSGNFFTSTASSARYKIDIEPSEIDKDKLLSLSPITFRYDPEQVTTFDPMTGERHGDGRVIDSDIAEGLQFGITAEQVDEVGLPLLVHHNLKTNELSGVRYELFGLALLPIVREHEAKITELERRLEAL